MGIVMNQFPLFSANRNSVPTHMFFIYLFTNIDEKQLLVWRTQTIINVFPICGPRAGRNNTMNLSWWVYMFLLPNLTDVSHFEQRICSKYSMSEYLTEFLYDIHSCI